LLFRRYFQSAADADAALLATPLISCHFLFARWFQDIDASLRHAFCFQSFRHAA
jgi:hypothetical protein